MSSYSGDYATPIRDAASKYGIDPNLLYAVAKQESDVGNGIDNGNIMQVNGMDNATAADSIDAGAKMLSNLLQQTGGNVEKALAAYNMGSGILDYMNQTGLDPRAAMASFSANQKQKYGYNVYGDPNYIDHVLRYQ